VIAVMTTHLPSLDMGRAFIRALSLDAFDTEAQMANWHEAVGVRPFNATNGVTPPDLRYWQHSGANAMQSGGR
jgi:hypothetical protein